MLAGEPTFNKLGAWPWSRRYHAELLGRLGYAHLVLLDIIMPESGEVAVDSLLSAGVGPVGNVVVAGHLATVSGGRVQSVPPYPLLGEAAAQIGMTNVDKDLDGYLRYLAPVRVVGEKALASFPLAAAAALSGEAPLMRENGSYELFIGKRRVPLNDEGHMWVQFSDVPIKRYEYLDVLTGAVPAEAFRDKIVVVGVAASGAADFHVVPDFPGNKIIPGAEFNARALCTMLWGQIPVRVSVFVAGLATFLLALLGGYAGTRRPGLGYLLLISSALAYAGLVHMLFLWEMVWLDAVIPLSAMALSFAGLQGLRYIFIHKDWEYKTLSVQSIAGLDADTIGKFDEYADFIEAIWPEVSKGTGVKLVETGVKRSTLNYHKIPLNRQELKVVKPGPDGNQSGLIVQVSSEVRNPSYVFLGWNGYVSQNMLRTLSAVIQSSAWLFNSIKEADRRQDMLVKTIRSIFTALDFRDPITGGHSNRVSTLTREIMEVMNFKNTSLIEDVYLGALIHDVGKIGISDSVLLKKGKLTNEEFDFIKRHPEIGMEIVKSVGLPKVTIKTIVQHHERFDGSGYPGRLSGKHIYLGARIVAVADVFDALTSDRPYRKGWSVKQTCDYIESMSGIYFDPLIVNALLELKRVHQVEKKLETGTLL